MEAQNRFRITITGKGQARSFDIDKDSCVLGRGKDCDITLDDDLISRHHLKISIENNLISVEELGSTNGSWLNNVKMEKGKKISYSPNANMHLGGLSGLSLSIENLSLKSNLINIHNSQVSSDPEKTLVYSISTNDFKNLQSATSSTSSVATSTSTLKVANGTTETISFGETTQVAKKIKLVEDPTQKISVPEKKPDIKKSLESQVKHLVNQESEKLREISLKEANSIRQKALEEEKTIQSKAEKNAQEIIENSKALAAKQRQEAELSILSLKEKIKNSENESVELIKNLKADANQIEERISSLKQIEAGHIQKMKLLEDEFSQARERVRNESILLEELKQQSLTIKKSADLKLEELALEERRSRAKLETEILEARTQTAKIFAEAEKALTQKEMLDPEILQLKSEKSRVEREINEAQINCRRLEYDYEKISKDYNSLLSDTEQAKTNLDTIIAKSKVQKDKNLATQIKLDEKEKQLQIKLDNSQAIANQLIESAKLEANQIILEAQAKSQKQQEQNEEALKDLELYKSKFNEVLDHEKKNKIKEVQNEIESLKANHAQDLEKLELKKSSVMNEVKWLEANALKACEKLINQGKTEAQDLKDQALKNIEVLKIAAKNDVLAFKERTLKELNSAKENAMFEIQNLKRDANTEIANMKNEASTVCNKMKLQAQTEIDQLKNDVKREHARATEEVQAAEVVKKSLQAALIKTENLMDDNYIQADLKVKSMIAKAQEQVSEIEKEGQIIKARELAEISELRRIEAEKIEEAKAKFEEFKINSKNETAELVSAAVSEYLIIEMVKSRNLVLDEKLIKKISERSKKITTDATLGRIHASTQGANALLVKSKKQDFSGVIRVFLTITMVIGFIYLIKTNPEQVDSLIKSIKTILKEQNITLPF